MYAPKFFREEDRERVLAGEEMKGAVGFVEAVRRIEAGYKLSQNRDNEDHATIIREPEKRGDPDSARVAAEMRRNRPPE
ncbi:MAG: hypothetical protein P4L36_17135 [Holophaga sp.]|nr:hypothetical protein [Holophaga sp.]